MPEYLAPGVYVEEVDTGNKPIEGVSTSTAGFVGKTARGPSRGRPKFVDSFAEFQRVFGGYLPMAVTSPLNYLPAAIEAFFTNGGKRAYVLRVLTSETAATKKATPAKTTSLGGMMTRLAADAPSSNAKEMKLLSTRGIQNGTQLQLRSVRQGVVVDSAVLTVDTVAGNLVTLTADLPDAATDPKYDAASTVVYTNVESLKTSDGTIVNLATPKTDRKSTIDLTAADEGAWGRTLRIQTGVESSATAKVDAVLDVGSGATPLTLKLASSAGFYKGAWVEIIKGNTKRYFKVSKVDGLILELEGIWSGGTAPATVSTCEFSLSLALGNVVENFRGLTLENIPGRFIDDVLKKGSSLLRSNTPTGVATDPFAFPTGGLVGTSPAGLLLSLDTDGSDGEDPKAVDYKGGGDPGDRTGLAALEDVDEISIIAAPGQTDMDVQGAMIDQCERLKDRFAVLDPTLTATFETIKDQRQQFDTKYAAIYYPPVLIRDPLTDTDIPCPPSGHIVGIYAQTDVERGVHKAPANVVVRGITGLARTVTRGQQEILNPPPYQINVIRDFRTDGRGYRVWGARCITSDPDWKYVNVRRLFIFLEESIDQGTQWVVFEPNDEPLWARVRASVSAFLKTVWRDGALQGRTTEQAYYVKCDRTTMTQADIDNGRLIMEIGVAPVKPAEFVIFRIGQWTGSATDDEA